MIFDARKLLNIKNKSRQISKKIDDIAFYFLKVHTLEERRRKKKKKENYTGKTFFLKLTNNTTTTTRILSFKIRPSQI